MESAFLSEGRQYEWISDHHCRSTGYLMDTFHRTHEQLFHDTFIAPSGVPSKNNQNLYEALEDIATILKDRGRLPEKFNEYALNVDELPWKKSLTSP